MIPIRIFSDVIPLIDSTFKTNASEQTAIIECVTANFRYAVSYRYAFERSAVSKCLITNTRCAVRDYYVFE